MSTNNIYRFLCNVICDCNESKKYKNSLVLSSFVLVIPTFLLLKEGWFILGTNTGVLFITSTIYHSIHKSWIRAIDVIMVYIVGGGGGLYVWGMTAMYPSSADVIPFYIALISFIALNFINLSSYCSYQAPCGSVIYIQYHACVHLLTAVVLSSVAIGFHF